MALTRLRTKHGADHLRAWSLDFSHAYKTIALHPNSSDASYICFINPTDNRPYKSKILVQPFGSRRAPANWGRVVTFIQFLAFRLLHIVVGAFVDDVYCAESAKLSGSSFWADTVGTAAARTSAASRRVMGVFLMTGSFVEDAGFSVLVGAGAEEPMDERPRSTILSVLFSLV